MKRALSQIWADPPEAVPTVPEKGNADKKKKKKKDKKRKDKKRDKHAGHLHSRCCDLFWTKSMGVWVQVKKLVWFAWLKRQVPADRRVFA